MTTRLYQFATSPFCHKIRKILDYKGFAYEVREVDYLDRRDLLAASGQILVPALTLENNETLVESELIALRLEEICPDPAIFPAQWRGTHLALARYFDQVLEDVLFRAVVPDEMAYFRKLGSSYEAFWRLIRERKYGSGFCDQMMQDHARNLGHVRSILSPLDQDLAERAFLLGRIGYADFALYGQLSLLAITGELKISIDLLNLRAYYHRMDQISSLLESRDAQIEDGR
jgi:glutathione S-transferase